MVSDRCILVVRQQLDELGLPYKNVQLREVELLKEPKGKDIEQLKGRLASSGFEVLDDKRAKLVEKIKGVIIDLIHRQDDVELNKKVSVLLEGKLGTDDHYLSTLFSSVEGLTIEKYLILQRVERAKELIVYDELNLSFGNTCLSI
jgi:AraC family transcriptional regulator